MLHVDSVLDDSHRRESARGGQAFAYSPTGESLALTGWVRVVLEEAFTPFAPTDARLVLDAHRFAAGLAPAALELAHHPQTTSMLRALLERYGCDPELTYLDVPLLHGRLGHPSGLAAGDWGVDGRYRPDPVGRPLRDPQRSVPPAGAIDWWMPIYPLDEAAAPAPRELHRVAPGGGRFRGTPTEASGRADGPLTVAPGGLLLHDPRTAHPAVGSLTERAPFLLHLRTVTLYDPQVGDTAEVRDALRDYRRAADGAWLSGSARAHAYQPGMAAPPV